MLEVAGKSVLKVAREQHQWKLSSTSSVHTDQRVSMQQRENTTYIHV